MKVFKLLKVKLSENKWIEDFLNIFILYYLDFLVHIMSVWKKILNIVLPYQSRGTCLVCHVEVAA